MRPRPPPHDATSPVPRQRPRRLAEQLAAATGRADQARWQHTGAQHRLDTPARAGDAPPATNSPPPMCAVSEPSNTSNASGTAPARTSTGTTRREHAPKRPQAALDRHDSRVRLRRTVHQVPVLRRQVEALGLWSRWARGDTVNVQQLGDTIAQLTGHHRRDEHADQFRQLGQAVHDWAEDAGIDLPTRGRHTRTLERAGLEIDL